MNRNRIKICLIFSFTLTLSLIFLESNYKFLNEYQRVFTNVSFPRWIYNKSFYERTSYNQVVYECDIFIKKAYQKFLIDGKLYPNIVPIYHNKSIDLNCLNKKSRNSIKKILLWTKFNGLPLIPVKLGSQLPFEDLKCPVTNCELTDDRSKLEESSLVLFHLRNSIDYFPSKRPRNQRWVHIIYESPINCHLCDKYENTFNLSATYTKDSDFSSIYWTDSGLYWDNDENDSNYTHNQDIYASKTEFAAALISACGAPSSRSDYIRELQNHVAINLYGKCGRPCPSNEDCRQFISRNYKFFILFENSICRDYITEKFFETLRYDVIPIVLGGGDYSYYAPKSGYINAMDFKTPFELAKYLNYLDNNKTAYNGYFAWKKYIRYDKNYPRMAYLCEMCIQLHLEEQTGQLKKKQLNSLKKLYNMNENCYGSKFENKSLKISKGDNLAHSFYMSPE